MNIDRGEHAHTNDELGCVIAGEILGGRVGIIPFETRTISRTDAGHQFWPPQAGPLLWRD